MSFIDKNPRKKRKCKILLCKCQEHNLKFCVRLDQYTGEKEWKMAYAFKYNDLMKNEDYIKKSPKINVKIVNSPEYNGCPYCGNKTLNFCNCGGIFCANQTGKAKCPWCHKIDYYDYSSNFNIKSFNS
ncbi:MAG: TerY-C metal binding domain-containing protein [Oscillospiraceae bacterium]